MFFQHQEVSPITVIIIKQKITALLEEANFSDDISRLSIELEIRELMKYKRKIEEQLNQYVDQKNTEQEQVVETQSKHQEEFIQKASKELEQWKRRIKRLQRRAVIHQAYLGKETKQTIWRLKKRKEFLYAKLRELKAASSQQWKQIKPQFENGLQEFRSSFHNALEQIA